ncbi:MAG: hypothetical protein K2Q26_06885 [Bdellovibrionales bacterium]|nr:hypothetical protein [Bdellovibrionales bacterium]
MNAVLKIFIFVGVGLASMISVANDATVTPVNDIDDFTESYAQTLRPQMRAYRRFGPPYYRPSMEYPVLPPVAPYKKLVEHPFPISNRKAINAGADETGWVPVPVTSDAVYYRAEYHLKDLGADVDQLITETERHYSTKFRRKWVIAGSDREALMQAKLHMLMFPMDKFKVKFHPGTYLLKHTRGARDGAPIRGTRGGIPWRLEYDRVDPTDYSKLVGVFKGTFDNKDCIRGQCLPGLIVDGKTIDAPFPNLATIAMNSDGQILMGRYGNIGNTSMNWLRQNEYPVIENGQIVEDGAFPTGWNRFGDVIMRTYMVTSQDGKYFGYVWTMFSHPSFVAKLLHQMGIQNMMVIDIHPAVGAGVAQPMALEKGIPFFSKEGMYPFILPESEAISNAEAAVGSWIRGSPMQWPINWAKTGSATDFFSVLLK